MAWLLQTNAACSSREKQGLFVPESTDSIFFSPSSPTGFAGKKSGTEISPALREKRYYSLWEL